MIINKHKIPYFCHEGLKFLSHTVLDELVDWTGQAYYLVQFIHTSNFTTEKFDLIFNQSILTQIRKGTLKLILGNQLESFHSIIEDIYKIFVDTLNLPIDNILLCTNSPNILPTVSEISNKYSKKEIKTIWARELEYTISKNSWQNPYCKFYNNIYPKKFICLNRRWRPHRPALIGLLKIKNLLDYGFISLIEFENQNWNTAFDTVSFLTNKNETFSSLWKTNKDQIINISPLSVDTSDLDDNYDYLRPELIKFYENSFFSIITETTFYTTNGYENSIHISEKTYKTIAMCHPFIMMNNPYALRVLKQLGYKTFSPYIDESYDEILDDGSRMLKIIENIEKLCRMNSEEIKKFIEFTREICEYNYQNLLLKRLQKNSYITILN